MTNVLWIILSVTIGLGTSQSIEGSTATTLDEPPWRQKTDCYINGVWYNPCPSDYVQPPPDIPPPSQQ